MSSYNFFEIQSKIAKLWDEFNVFKTEKLNSKKIFTIDTPPPTVSGSLHIGHVFSYTQTDIIARYKRLNGFTVFYPFGFDDNGLPTERYVEKELGILSYNYSRSDFVNICLEETKKVHDDFKNLWKILGISSDWTKCYSTISPEVQKISQKSFIDLYKKGYIYKKDEPALYCTMCRTSVSQADLEEIEKETFFTTIKFKIKDTNEEILIATTRPEMLSGCVSIFFNPEDDRYKKFENKIAITPIYNSEVKILPDDKVIKDKGTGLVMCCTFGDSLDVYWFKKHNLPFIKVINLDGKMSELTGFLSGKSVKDARDEILKKLLEDNYIHSQVKIKHTVSIYERSKREIEYVMLKQWFVKILPFKEKFIELGNQIKWHPESMKNRYINWVESLEWDWCISRQRFFGIPFPVWYDKNNNIILAEEKDLPIDPLKNTPSLEEDYTPDMDVMDTWNTSSITPLICQNLYESLSNDKAESFFPMSIRPQAHDIIRTWAFDTIVKSWMEKETIPWNEIVISGHVLSKDSEKISKSKGNSPLEPLNLIKIYSSDAIRYWTASSKLGIDTAFSEEKMKDGNRLLIKLWNAAICIANIGNFKDYLLEENFKPKLEVNKWILFNLENCFDKYKKYLDEYEYSLALNSIESFFWNNFCEFYLEIIKVYFSENNIFSENDRLEISKVSAYTFYRILQLFSPYISFITEEIYNSYYRKDLSFESIHKTRIDNFNYINSKNEFDAVIDFIKNIRKVRSELKVSFKAEIKMVNFESNNKNISEKIILEINMLKKVCNINEIKNKKINKVENSLELIYFEF